jgi:hypothetical protein
MSLLKPFSSAFTRDENERPALTQHTLMQSADAISVPTPTDQPRPTRIFVGLKVAPEIAQALAQLARALERFSVRLIQAADMHLTLVPPWDEPSIGDAIQKLRPVAGRFSAFPLAFQRAEYGP